MQHAAPASGMRHGCRALVLLLLLAVFPASAAPRVDLAIEGIGGELLDNVRARLSLAREAEQPQLNEYRVQALYRRAPREIREALEPFGYYAPTITPTLTQRGDGWLVRFLIDPGLPTRVTAVDVAVTGPGADDPRLREWRGRFPLRPGDPLRQQHYETAKDDLLALADRLGYRQAQLTSHRIEVNAGERSAVIRLQMATGPRYGFGEVRFEEVPLAHDLLVHYLPFKPGEPYDADLLARLQRSLVDSDYFERVEVAPLPADGAAQSIPVEVRLAMRPRSRYTAGAGYGTDTGPRLTAGFLQRWVNARGHRFDARTTVSGIGYQLATEYRILLSRPESDYFHIRANLEREQTESTDRDTALISAGITRSRGVWMRTVALTYQEEQFDVASQSDRSGMLYPNVTWQQISADDRVFPTRGWRLGVTARAAAEELGSATSLLQGVVSGKYIHPFGGDRLIGRFDAGASNVGNFDVLPVSLRFFAGGDQSVRGYGYEALGPKDEKGEVIGGRYLLVGSIEYDHYFDDRYGLALFYDVGSAYNDRPETLDAGAGFGLRVRFPFAVVRLDLASAITDPDLPWRLHLSIGPEL